MGPGRREALERLEVVVAAHGADDGVPSDQGCLAIARLEPDDTPVTGTVLGMGSPSGRRGDGWCRSWPGHGRRAVARSPRRLPQARARRHDRDRGPDGARIGRRAAARSVCFAQGFLSGTALRSASAGAVGGAVGVGEGCEQVRRALRVIGSPEPDCAA